MTDDRMPPQGPLVEAFLASLAETPVPRDLAAAVSTGVRERPTRPPSLRLLLLAATAGLLLVVGVAMAAGWKPPFDVVPGPETTALPSPSAAPTLAAWGGIEFLRVVEPGAPVTTEPGGGLVLRTVTEEDIGEVVLVRDRREVAGDAWVKVEWEGEAGQATFVWIPEKAQSVAPVGGRVTVFEPAPQLTCDASSDVEATSLLGMTLAQRLACFGPRSFTLGPVRVEAVSTDGQPTGSPAWLAGPADATITATSATDHSGDVAPLRIDPAVGLRVPRDRSLRVPRDRWLRLTVHLDDAAAAGCQRHPTDASQPVGDASDQVLWCRQQLVVTSAMDDIDPGRRLSP